MLRSVSVQPPGYRKHRRAVSEMPDRLICRICGFPLNSVAMEPGEGFPTRYRTTGTTYVWTDVDASLATVDLTVFPQTNPAVSCAFCGGTRVYDGQKGLGQ